jgi:hypothetical protein
LVRNYWGDIEPSSGGGYCIFPMVKTVKNTAMKLISWGVIEMPTFFNIVFMEDDQTMRHNNHMTLSAIFVTVSAYSFNWHFTGFL